MSNPSPKPAAERATLAPAGAESIDPSAAEPEANKLFRMVMKHKGSDLHLKVGLPPAMRLARRPAARCSSRP